MKIASREKSQNVKLSNKLAHNSATSEFTQIFNKFKEDFKRARMRDNNEAQR